MEQFRLESDNHNLKYRIAIYTLIMSSAGAASALLCYIIGYISYMNVVNFILSAYCFISIISSQHEIYRIEMVIFGCITIAISYLNFEGAPANHSTFNHISLLERSSLVLILFATGINSILIGINADK